jgi:organic radical activating enzyme
MPGSKEYIDNINKTYSKTFCGAKYYNATIWLGSGQTSSCHHPPQHAIDVDALKANPKALHNTTQKKLERSQMQKGERPPGCEYCWKLEDAGQISDRVWKTGLHDKDNLLEKAFNSNNSEDFNLRTLEIAFDRTCQFACSYCNPAFSTTWVRDIKDNGPYTDLTSDGAGHFDHAHDAAQLFKAKDDNPYVEAFFKWWESDLHKTLDELRITGGEPLMTEHTWRLLDWFQKNKGQSNTRLAINSNLGFDTCTVDKLLDATEGIELDLYTSNESIGAQAEYIRDGHNYEQWKDNIEYLLKSKRLRRLHIMCTINALCLESLPQLLNQILKWKKLADVSFSLNILQYPRFQSVLVLPKELRERFEYNLMSWIGPNNNMLEEHEKDHVLRLIGYLQKDNKDDYGKMQMLQEPIESPMFKDDFKNFYKQYDKRRNKNFAETFPIINKWVDI